MENPLPLEIILDANQESIHEESTVRKIVKAQRKNEDDFDEMCHRLRLTDELAP